MSRVVDPRIERTRAVVLETAIQIVAERGFAGASIDSISQRSGVARSTIYRHWPSRMELLLEAVGSRIGDIESLAVGDFRGDLVAVSMHLAHMLASELIGSVAASIIFESRQDPALDELRERLVTERMRDVERIVHEAIARGELRDDADSYAIATDLAAPIFMRSLILRAPIDQTWVEEHVDRVLRLHCDES